MSYSTASASRREAHERYITHSLQCPRCTAAGQGYGVRCPEGEALWRAYFEFFVKEGLPQLPRNWWNIDGNIDENERSSS
ncbi:hypothetical protein Tchar_00944 [Tepidimonas charontis]|uniref:Uncharacterized protein n=1 Tax=Tepidimonas charontis TaxID=2267262 RepID=A0A554XH50_9BURK|nr:hypothetical protein Tchar_00944 [Tepidimonas charontis]